MQIFQFLHKYRIIIFLKSKNYYYSVYTLQAGNILLNKFTKHLTLFIPSLHHKLAPTTLKFVASSFPKNQTFFSRTSQRSIFIEGKFHKMEASLSLHLLSRISFGPLSFPLPPLPISSATVRPLFAPWNASARWVIANREIYTVANSPESVDTGQIYIKL